MRACMRACACACVCACMCVQIAAEKPPVGEVEDLRALSLEYEETDLVYQGKIEVSGLCDVIYTCDLFIDMDTLIGSNYIIYFCYDARAVTKGAFVYLHQE